MNATAAQHPFSFAGVPADSWAFGVRIWAAVVVSLCASFWLELEAPSSAAITIAILAVPTRGQALEKAVFRLIATIIGVVVSIAIVGLFAQTRDLLLAAFAAWLGFCVYAAGLLDGNRAYAAVLSGYTVALVAVQQIDTPRHVFESGVARGAAIAVGIAAIAIVNDLLVAPDSHPQLAGKLAALHGQVCRYAIALIRDESTDPTAIAELVRDIAALRSGITGLATESSSGWVRSAAARSTTVALVAELHAARALNALPVAADPGFRERLTSALGRSSDERSPVSFLAWVSDTEKDAADPLAVSLACALGELLRRDEEVREGLAAFLTRVHMHGVGEDLKRYFALGVQHWQLLVLLYYLVGILAVSLIGWWALSRLLDRMRGIPDVRAKSAVSSKPFAVTDTRQGGWPVAMAMSYSPRPRMISPDISPPLFRTG